MEDVEKTRTHTHATHTHTHTQLQLERASPLRTRLTRLVEEVEKTRRTQKEIAIRNEEKAKLQKMKCVMRCDLCVCVCAE